MSEIPSKFTPLWLLRRRRKAKEHYQSLLVEYVERRMLGMYDSITLTQELRDSKRACLELGVKLDESDQDA